MRIEINKENIQEYAKRYDKRSKGTKDEIIYNEMINWLKCNRFLDKERFLKIWDWKSPYKYLFKKIEEKNEDERIKRITKIAFSPKTDEKDRITLLLGQYKGLYGVGYPVASAILHFAFPDKYPILDTRALESLGIVKPKSYNFYFWQRYCDEIREISQKVSEDIRTIDKAIWMYSKENKKSKCKV